MRALLVLGLAAWFSGAASPPALAGAFDGSVPLLRALRSATECTPSDGCQGIQPEDVGAPDFFLIDVSSKQVQGLGVEGRMSAIHTAVEIGEKLILQGADQGIEGVRDGLGWSASVDQVTGRLVLTASGEQVAFVVFGACAALTGVAQTPQ